jgi:AraC-like DNA-binding protein
MGTFQLKIVVLLCSIVFLPICLLAALNFNITWDNAQSQTQKFSRQLLSQAMNEHALMNEQINGVLYDMLASGDKYMTILDHYYTDVQTLSFIREMDQRLAIQNRYIASIYILDLQQRQAYSTFDHKRVTFEQFYDRSFLSSLSDRDGLRGVHYMNRNIYMQNKDAFSGMLVTAQEKLQRQNTGFSTYYIYFGGAGPKAGVIAINIRQSFLLERDRFLQQHTGGFYFITGPRGETLYRSASGGDLLDKVRSEYGDDPGLRVRIGDMHYLNMRLTHSVSGMDYWLLIPEPSFSKLVYRQSAVFVLIGLVSTVLSIVAVIAASRYLYKPVSHVVREIGHMLPRAKQSSQIDELGYVRSAFLELVGDRRSLSDVIREQSEPIRQNILRRLVRGKLAEAEALPLPLRLPFIYPYFVVMAIGMDTSGERWTAYSETDVELTGYAVRNIAEETLSGKLTSQTLSHGKDTVIVIGNSASPPGQQQLAEWATCVQRNVSEFLGLTLDIGIGSVRQGLECVWMTYEEAIKCLSYNKLMEPGKITSIDELKRKDEELPAGFSWSDYEQEYMKHVRHCDEGSMAVLLQSISDEARRQQASSLELHRYGLQFSACLIKLIEEYNVPLDHEDMFAAMTRALQSNRFAELQLLVQQTTQRLIEMIRKKRTSLNRDIVTRAEALIGNDLGMTVENVAEAVSLSPPTLNRLFREFVGMTAGEYIYAAKIKEAKKLLLETDRRIEIIAERIGYTSSRGFYKVFKEATGMTPSEYRRLHGGTDCSKYSQL